MCVKNIIEKIQNHTHMSSFGQRLQLLHNRTLINYPTVPRGTERLRITPSPNHTNQMTLELVKALKEVFSKINLS